MKLSDIQVLIVDDEPDGAAIILEYLHHFFPGIRKVLVATGLSQARQELKRQKTDILFLDIRLQEGTSFQLLQNEQLLQDTVVIFATGYEQYALQAIKVRPFDYLLKPVNPEEFRDCLNKCLDHLREQARLRALEKRVSRELILSESGQQHRVKFHQILYCHSTGAYTSFAMDSGKRILVSKAMGSFQEELEKEGFFRIHNSFIVNMKHVIALEGEGHPRVHLDNGEELPVSRRRRSEFARVFRKPAAN